MKRFLLIETLAIIISFSIAACGTSTSPSQGGAAPASTPNTLTAVKVDATSLDAGAAFWAQAPKLEVATVGAAEGKSAGPTVTLQAAYDGQYIVIRGEWADPTSSTAKNAWKWDGAAFSKSDDEDRIMITWPVGNNALFASKGCTAACHSTSTKQEEWWMGSDSADVRYDNWHWKAARTNPVGYTDDQWWTVLADPADVESSRLGDAKDSGGYSDNISDDKSGPAFMSAKGAKEPFILAADKVAIDTTKLAAGDIIPGFVIAKPVGSRGDIEAKGVWADGKWVVVQRRLLSTGHDDDASFSPPKPMPFGFGVVDNGGGLDHKITKDVMTLEWK